MKNFGDSGDARMLRHLNEKDDRRLSLPQRGFMPILALFLRFRHRKKMIAASKSRMAAPPAAMPAIAAVLMAGALLALLTVEGSTIWMRLVEKTESLKPNRSVVFGLCRQPASRATSADICELAYHPSILQERRPHTICDVVLITARGDAIQAGLVVLARKRASIGITIPELIRV